VDELTKRMRSLDPGRQLVLLDQDLCKWREIHRQVQEFRPNLIRPDRHGLPILGLGFRKLAAVIRTLTLSESEIKSLPDTYALAIKSGRFASEHRFDPAVDYLPPGLFTMPDEWQEIDFFQPTDIHEDIQERFVTLHTRNYKGRSGPGRLYLASPLSVAASAVEGEIVEEGGAS
jgi:hypothetical protein